MEEEKVYHSLSDIQRRRRQLHNELVASEKVIAHHWHTLTHRDRHPLGTTPTERLSHLVAGGASLLDGALLLWKLYRRFKH